MKKLNNKGFTLVEIVIVIVIIAILAAMLVPSLTAWIDKSKTKTFTSACGTIKTAVWSQAAEAYAVDGTVPTIDNLKYDEITNDVGKDVKKASGGDYNITVFDYSNDKITIVDKTGKFTGVWDGKTSQSWNVTNSK